jgi:XTP/dITP diphosphohydrolase
MRLFLATKNEGKVKEIRGLMDHMGYELTSLIDYPEIPDVVEDGETFVANARIKAQTIADITGCWTLADDSGLVVDALNGAPGVHSARYAGSQGDHAANNDKLMSEMNDVPDGERGAAFVCTMVLVSPDGDDWTVEGRCDGVIGRGLVGSDGFGYDPLFCLPGEGKTMAELPLERKNELSHRGQALKQMIKVIERIAKNSKCC